MTEQTLSTTTSTYLAYKQDTNAFVSWLGSTAKACGWRPPKKVKEDAHQKSMGSDSALKTAIASIAPDTNKGQRLKGKERKEAKARVAAAAAVEASIIRSANTPAPKPSAKYTITTEQMVQQMDIVAKSNGPVTMPSAINNALKRAVRGREKFASWYQKTEHSTESALDGHTYFIGVLRRAMCLFPGPSSKEGVRDSNILESQSTDNGETFMANMFAALEIEEVSDEDECSGYVSVPQTENMPTMEFEIKETEADIDFAIFALFEDIYRIRTETKEILRRLAAGEVGLVHATLSVAAALELVRQADDEVNDLVHAVGYQNFAEAFSTGSYPAYVAKIYSSDALGRAHAKRSMLTLDPFDEFVLLPVGYTLSKIRFLSDHPWANDGEGMSKVPMPLPPLRIDSEFTHASDVEHLNHPRVRKGEADDQFLTQLYQDMILIESIKDGRLDSILAPPPDRSLPPGTDDLKPRVLNSTLPYFDVLHNALRSIWTQKVISMQSVFAAQTLVDIHDICGSSVPGAQRQLQEAKLYDKRLDFNHDVDPTDADDTALRDLGPFWAPDSKQLVIRLFGLLTDQVIVDPIWTVIKEATLLNSKELRERWVREANTDRYKNLNPHIPEGWEPPKADYMNDPWAVNITGIWPNDSPTFLMDNNPLYGGTALLDIVSSFELASIAIANESMSILCMAHIYNAARQLGLLQVQWVELDRVIDLQAAAIFANDIPTTPKAIFERFRYRLGLGLSKSQVATRSLVTVHKGTDAPWKLKPSQASTMIRQTLDAQVPLPRLLHWLEAEAFRSGEDRRIIHGQQQRYTKNQGPSVPTAPKGPERAALVPSSNSSSSQRQMSLRQSLQRIETHLDAVVLDIDYLNLTRACEHQLAKLREKLVSKLNVGYVTTGSRNEGFEARVEMTIGIMHENLKQADAYDEAVRRKKKKKRVGKDQSPEHGDADVKPIGRQLEYAAKLLAKMLSKGESLAVEK